jgi:hypothetical protein
MTEVVNKILAKRIYRVRHKALDDLLWASRKHGAAEARNPDSIESRETYEAECDAFRECMKDHYDESPHSL